MKKIIIFALSLIILFLSFSLNFWKVADVNWFNNFQKDTESYIVGRMVKARRDGILSAGGFPINVMDSSRAGENRFSYQYDLYLEDASFNRCCSIYKSQIGGQGMIFSFLDKLIQLPSATKLQLFYYLTSLLSAVALSFIVLWFFDEFGTTVAISVLVSMMISQWLTVFGKNLWWSLWAFYLPMLTVMYFLKNKQAYTGNYLELALLTAGAVFVKTLINGYEYITTTLIMMLVPLVYYAIKNKLSTAQFVKTLSTVLLGATIAVVSSLAILVLQIASISHGELGAGIHHILFSLGKRSYGSVNDYPDAYAASLKSNVFNVVIKYFTGTFFNLGNYLTTKNNLVNKIILHIRYAYLVILFLLSSLLLIWGKTKKNLDCDSRRKYLSLVIATWFSSLAPLSWFVLFKAHSYIHLRMNFIVWQMPFTFFGFAVCGLLIDHFFSRISHSLKIPY